MHFPLSARECNKNPRIRIQAKNLLKHGKTVTVFDLAPAAVKSLTDAGAKKAASIAELANG